MNGLVHSTKCGSKMIFDRYEMGPHKENEVFGNKLSDLSHPMLSHLKSPIYRYIISINTIFFI